MKTITVKVIDNYEGSILNQGCFEVEITSKVSGVLKKIEAFVNENNYVSVRSGTFIHSLFANAPFNSEFVKLANDELQNSFKNWNPQTTHLNVNI